ncbi:ParA family protein [Desulfolutivibrio sulfoxidireducens]|uniref:ParA family protein n=1 Tax=Desulfolutivibrio sulfoxidireducens TaxID=2773299 RepID=UPI00159E5371|nr:ParA family protein [Desulfolutivibrio sulfoxidireducens]QLA17749.1 AAA family ATPase [Desulfolutivibrio sulfoxidireducens]QLA21325.1 AAA family ATPase [Desulfolutivibrio sulfoxidireducens]
MRTVAVINQKGGVGKTTTAHNLGAGLSRRGLAVLLVDADPQAHLTAAMGADAGGADLSQVLLGECPPEKAVLTGPGPHLLPASIALAGLESRLSAAGREDMLHAALAGLSGYDLAVIDCPPNLGLLTVCALRAATEALVPMQAEFLALRGLAALVETLRAVRGRVNPELLMAGILLTRFEPRRKLGREVTGRIRAHFPGLLFETRIRDNVSLAEAPGFGQDIFAYAPTSRGALDYGALCAELAGRPPRPVP